METVTVNGHACQTGCVLSGSRGWRITGQLIDEVAVPLGYVNTLDDGVLSWFYLDNDAAPVPGVLEVDVPEYVTDESDRALDWLNEHTPEGYVWHWMDGELFLSTVEDADNA